MTDAQRQAIPAGSLHHGLLVFQTNNGSITSPQGFWYYDATVPGWLLMAPAQGVWTLSGNVVGTSAFLGSLDNNDIVFKTGLVTAVERMRVYNSTKGGNVQFGNSGNGTHYVFPAAKGTAGDVLQLDPTGTTNNLLWKPMSSTGGPAWLINGNNATGPSDFIGTNNAFPLNIATSNTLTPQPIVFYNGGAERMRIEENNGFVGIGTNSPLARFHVAGSSSIGPQVYVQNTASNQEATVEVTTPAGGNNIETILNAFDGGSNIVQVGRVGTITNHDMTFITGASKTEQRVYGVNGNVGMGKNTPANKLDVIGTHTATIIKGVNNSTSGGDAITGYSQGSGSGIAGINSGTGAGVFGYALGNANAGFFQTGNASSGVATIVADHQGLGSALVVSAANAANNLAVLDVSSGGGGSAIFSKASGTGSAGSFTVTNSTNASAAVNIGTNGVGHALFATTGGTGSAGLFQVTANTSTSPALFVTTAAPAPSLKVNGAGGTGAIAAMFNGGSVAIGTGTGAQTSGLDFKASLGVRLKYLSKPCSNDKYYFRYYYFCSSRCFLVPRSSFNFYV